MPFPGSKKQPQSRHKIPPTAVALRGTVLGTCLGGTPTLPISHGSALGRSCITTSLATEAGMGRKPAVGVKSVVFFEAPGGLQKKGPQTALGPSLCNRHLTQKTGQNWPHHVPLGSLNFEAPFRPHKGLYLQLFACTLPSKTLRFPDSVSHWPRDL